MKILTQLVVEVLRERKNTLVAQVVWFQMLELEASKSQNQKQNLFLKIYVTSEGAISHNVLYYQQHSIVHYQLSFFLLTFIF